MAEAVTKKKDAKRDAAKRGTIKTHVVKGDTVMLRRGKDKGKRGTVSAVFPREGMALVEGLNIVKRHMKQGQGNPASGRHYRERSTASDLDVDGR